MPQVLLLVYVRASELQAIFGGSPALENYVAQKKNFDLETLIIIQLTRLKNNLHTRDKIVPRAR